MKKVTKQQIATAPKYGLYIESLGWLYEKQGLSGVVFTEHKELAMQFAEGFDNPKIKIDTWTATFKHQYKINDIKFEAIYL